MIHELYHLKELFPQLGDGSNDPTLEVFVPMQVIYHSKEYDRLPGIIICPGGGYSKCVDRDSEPFVMHFLRMGYRVFLLRYSCKPYTYPAQIREAAAAMELIAQNVAVWHTDIHRIAILGTSAGGHVAAMYSTSYDYPEVREIFPDSKPVKATVLSFSVLTAQPEYRHSTSIINCSGHAELTEEDARFYSTELRVTEKTPPAFIWHTAQDKAVSLNNSLVYAQALEKHGVPFALRIYPFGNHGLCTVDADSTITLAKEELLAADWLEDCRNFLGHFL